MEAFFHEFKTTVNEIGSQKTDWRRVARRALPVAAAAAACTAGLCARKQLSPPEKEFLQRRASFECRPTDAHLSPAGALERFLESKGADVAALRRAARRMRGPIERDILLAEQTLITEDLAGAAAPRRQQLYESLLEQWRAGGYLSEPVEYKKPRAASLGLDLVTQQDESYGRDVGCEVPACLLQESAKVRCPSVEDTVAASEAIAEHGLVYLKSLLAPEEVQALRDRLHLKVSALDQTRARRGGFAPVREYDITPLQDEDPDLEPVVSTLGRRHLYLRNRAGELAVRDAQAGLMPLVWEYAMKASAAAGLPAGEKLYVSEVQLLVTDPCAIDQFWHIDNTAPGVTVLVPLTPVPVEIGPTMFLRGSHRLFGRVPDGNGTSFLARLSAFTSSLLDSEGVEVGTLNAGDAVVYDARLIHYGAANRLYDRTRVALVFRYDFERPPGMGFVGTQLISWLGNSLQTFLRFYGVLPGTTPGKVPAVAPESRSGTVAGAAA